MKAPGWRRTCLSSLVAVLSLSPARAGWTLPAASEKWIRVRTRHFTLVGNATAKVTTKAGLQLERFQAAFETAHADTALTCPASILVFKDLKSFTPYKLNEAGSPENFAGKFTADQDGNYIGMCADPEGDPYRIILHEYEHYLQSKIQVDFPLWLREGMAEFYSTFASKGNVVELGRPVENHVLLLRSVPFMPLDDLFAIDRTSKVYNEGIRQGIFYAESWLLYHFIFRAKPELRPNLDVFAQVHGSRALRQQAFKSAFGMDYAWLEEALQDYVQQESFKYDRLEFEHLNIDERSQVEPLPYAQVLYYLGDYMAHATPWRGRDAEDHLCAAIQADSTDARPHASLAHLIEKQDEARAERHYRRAIDLAPSDALPYYLYGLSKMNRFVEANPQIPFKPDSLPTPLRAARGLLGHSLELDPHRGEAYAGLGITYLFDPDNTPEGLAILDQARSLMPHRMDVVFNLMWLYLRSGDRPTAERLANQVLLYAEDPELQQRTRDTLEKTREFEHAVAKSADIEDYNLAVQKLNEGDAPAAIALLDHLLETTHDAEVADRARLLRDQAKQAREQQVRNRRVAALNRQIDMYNQALAKVKAGESKVARPILERLVLEAKDPELVRKSRELLEMLEARDPAPSDRRR